MSIARWWADQWPYVLGAAGVGGVALLAIAAAPKVGSAPPASPPLPPGSPPRVWLRLDGDPVELREGARYRGCIRLSWIMPTGMIAEKIPAKLAEKGFRDIVVSRVRPSDWEPESCSIYVEATWGKPAEKLARPSQVELAWESRPA